MVIFSVLNPIVSFEAKLLPLLLLIRFFPESQVAQHESDKLPWRHFRGFFTPAGVFLDAPRLRRRGRILFAGVPLVNGFWVFDNHYRVPLPL